MPAATPIGTEASRRWRPRALLESRKRGSSAALPARALRHRGYTLIFGGNDPDNLVMLCGAHHGALHRGRLRIDGKVSTGLPLRHADGTAYGFMPSPPLAEASARAFAGLRSLGFSEKTARASLERALSSAPTNATAEMLLRSAVARASCR